MCISTLHDRRVLLPPSRVSVCSKMHCCSTMSSKHHFTTSFGRRICPGLDRLLPLKPKMTQLLFCQRRRSHIVTSYLLTQSPYLISEYICYQDNALSWQIWGWLRRLGRNQGPFLGHLVGVCGRLRYAVNVCFEFYHQSEDFRVRRLFQSTS